MFFAEWIFSKNEETRMKNLPERYSWAVSLKPANNMVWFLEQYLFNFSPSVVHLMLFLLFFVMQKKVSHSNMHIKSKNQNIKRRMETKNISYFTFELKNPTLLIQWRRLVLWVKIATTLASHVLVVIFVVV